MNIMFLEEGKKYPIKICVNCGSTATGVLKTSTIIDKAGEWKMETGLEDKDDEFVLVKNSYKDYIICLNCGSTAFIKDAILYRRNEKIYIECEGKEYKIKEDNLDLIDW